MQKMRKKGMEHFYHGSQSRDLMTYKILKDTGVGYVKTLSEDKLFILKIANISS